MKTPTSDSARLITIPVSHYCEKARWALEYAGIPYAEERHLQIFHLLPAFRAGRGDSVPVLVTADGVYDDSTKIVEWADLHAPTEKKLYPLDARARREALAIEDELDEGFGVVGRLWMYTHLLHLPQVLAKYAKIHGVPAHESYLMPMIYPVVKRLVSRFIGMRPSSREYTQGEIDRTFDGIASRLSDGRPFLTGDRFTVADLTFAALAAPALIPPQYGVELPALSELPSEMLKQVTAWRKHRAGEFALGLYRNFRSGPKTS